MGIIYKLTSPSGKAYIGQTRQSLEKRLAVHKSEKRSRPLSNAIRKYGLDNCRIEILHECPIECLSIWEKIEIARCNTLFPNGYNLSAGGEHGCLGYKMTDEHKKKISDANKGRAKSPNSGRKKGSTTKPETRERISKASKEVWQRPGYKEKMSEIHRKQEETV